MSIQDKIDNIRKKKSIKKPEGVQGMCYQDYLDKQKIKDKAVNYKGLSTWKNTKGKKLKSDYPKTHLPTREWWT